MDDIRDENNGVGPNTSGWDWHGTASGASSAASAVPAQAQPSGAATLSAVQQDCQTAVSGLNNVASPLGQQDAAGVVAAGQAAQAAAATVGTGSDAVEYPNVVLYARTVLAEISTIGTNAAAYENGGASWSVVTEGEASLVSSFKSLESACSAAGVTIGGDQSRPAATAVPSAYSVGCPTSGQLLAAWNAASDSTRQTWTSLSLTGFQDTECWKQWVTAKPIASDNEDVEQIIFTDNDEQIAVLPGTQSGFSEFTAAVCGNTGAPSSWTTKADGSTSCS